METIILKPLLHKAVYYIGIYFSPALNKFIKQIPAVKWSQTNKCWYLPLQKEYYNHLMQAAKGNAVINNEALKNWLQKNKPVATTATNQNGNSTKTASLKTTIVTLSPPNTEALNNFLQRLQLKAYSPSTIKTYRNEFCQLLQTIKQKDVKTLTADEIKRYMAYAISKEGISENTAHSRLNALKFYFEQVLKRDKFFWEIPRPKNHNSCQNC
jgi:integrase/recombinase XerD